MDTFPWNSSLTATVPPPILRRSLIAQGPATRLQDSLSVLQSVTHFTFSLSSRVGTGGVKSPSDNSALKGTGVKNTFIGIYQNITVSWQKARWTFRIWRHLTYDFFSFLPREEHSFYGNTPSLTPAGKQKESLGEGLKSSGSQLQQFAEQQPLTLGGEGNAVLKDNNKPVWFGVLINNESESQGQGNTVVFTQPNVKYFLFPLLPDRASITVTTLPLSAPWPWETWGLEALNFGTPSLDTWTHLPNSTWAAEDHGITPGSQVKHVCVSGWGFLTRRSPSSLGCKD